MEQEQQQQQQREYHSSWSYDNSSVTPPPYHYHYHDDPHFNHAAAHYNHHPRYHNYYQDEPTDSSFGYANNGTAFAARKRHFSHGPPPEYFDGGGNAKLYVCGVPREVTEQDIRSLFGKYGNIIEVVLFKQLKSLQEQECCFVKYAKTEDAAEAIRALHNQHTFPGRMCPIEVRYASKKQDRPGFLKAHENKVFVSFLNKHASKAEIAQVFIPYGCVEDVFLMFDEQKQSRGTGFITFTDRDMAAAAINALNGKYVMKGCDQPLVVRFADPKKPKIGENRCAPYYSDPVGQTSLPNNNVHRSSQTGSEPPSVSSTSSVPTSMDPPDCDWSEHICPDGHAYYYNCVTNESRWEKPEEYDFYEQQPENCNPQWH